MTLSTRIECVVWGIELKVSDTQYNDIMCSMGSRVEGQ